MKKGQNYSDVGRILGEAIAAADKKPATVCREAGLADHQTAARIIKGKTTDPGIHTLDALARALGKEGWVHLVTDRPAIDQTILRESVMYALEYLRVPNIFWPVEWLARVILLTYRAHTDPTGQLPTEPRALSGLIMEELGAYPKSEAENAQFRARPAEP